MTRTLSVKDVCDRFGVGEHTVLRWVAAGELKAINTARVRDGKRPRYRITQEALDEFEAARTVAASDPSTRRRKKSAATARKFFPE